MITSSPPTVTGTNTTAETVGVAVIGAIGAGVAVHAAVSTGVHLKRRYENDKAVAKAKELIAAFLTAVRTGEDLDPTIFERNFDGYL